MNENAEDWMSRLRLIAVQCNYTEIDRQLEEQFIHRLNDNDLLVDVAVTKSWAKHAFMLQFLTQVFPR